MFCPAVFIVLFMVSLSQIRETPEPKFDTGFSGDVRTVQTAGQYLLYFSRKRSGELFLRGSSRSRHMLIILLLLSGDIESNPGPTGMSNSALEEVASVCIICCQDQVRVNKKRIKLMAIGSHESISSIREAGIVVGMSFYKRAEPKIPSLLVMG